MKLVLTAAEQAEAINQYIKREYNLEIKVYACEYDDKDMEVQSTRRPNTVYEVRGGKCGSF